MRLCRIGAVVGFEVVFQLRLRQREVVGLKVQHAQLKADFGNMRRVSRLEVILEGHNRPFGLLLLNVQPAKAVVRIRRIFGIGCLQRSFQLLSGLLAVLGLLKQHAPAVVRESGVLLVLGVEIVLIAFRRCPQIRRLGFLRLRGQRGIAVFGAAPRSVHPMRGFGVLLDHCRKMRLGGSVVGLLVVMHRQAEMHLVRMCGISGFEIVEIGSFCGFRLTVDLVRSAQQVECLSPISRVLRLEVRPELADGVRIFGGLHVQRAQPEARLRLVGRVARLEVGVEFADRFGRLLQFHVQEAQPEA